MECSRICVLGAFHRADMLGIADQVGIADPIGDPQRSGIADRIAGSPIRGFQTLLVTSIQRVKHGP